MMGIPGRWRTRVTSWWHGWLSTGAHTGAGAAMLTASDSVRRHLPDVKSASALAFFGVVGLYGTRYLVQATGGVRGEREHWLRRHLALGYLVVVGAMAAGALAALGCDTLRLAQVAMAGGLGRAYCFPLFGAPLRRFGAWKPFFLASAWALATSPWATGAIMPLASRFCALAGLCLVFDLKDRGADLAAGIHTPAVILGEAGLRVVAGVFFLAGLILGVGAGAPDLLAETLCLVSGGYLGTRSDSTFSTVGVADGGMMLAGVVGLLLNPDFWK